MGDPFLYKAITGNPIKERDIICDDSMLSHRVTAWSSIDKPFRSNNPKSISGLVAWFKADGVLWIDVAKTIPAIADSDPVGVWQDYSGLGNDAVQSTGTKKPTLKTSILSAKSVIRWDGIDDCLIIPSLSLGPKTVFIVRRNTTPASYNYVRRSIALDDYSKNTTSATYVSRGGGG